MKKLRWCVVVLMVSSVAGCDNPFSAPEPFTVQITGPSAVIADRTTYQTEEGSSYTYYSCRFELQAATTGEAGSSAEWVSWEDHVRNSETGNTDLWTHSAENVRQFWGGSTVLADQVLTRAWSVNTFAPVQVIMNFRYRVIGTQQIRSATYEVNCT